MANRLAYLLYKSPANEQGNRDVGVFEAECVKSLGNGVGNEYSIGLQVGQKDGVRYHYKFTVDAVSDKDAFCIISALGEYITKNTGAWVRESISCAVERDGKGKVVVVLKLDGDDKKIELSDERLRNVTNVIKQFKIESGVQPDKKALERFDNLIKDLEAAKKTVAGCIKEKGELDTNKNSPSFSAADKSKLARLNDKKKLKETSPLLGRKVTETWGIGTLGKGINMIGGLIPRKYTLEELSIEFDNLLEEVRESEKKAKACQREINGKTLEALYKDHQRLRDSENNLSSDPGPVKQQELVKAGLDRAETIKEIKARLKTLPDDVDIKAAADKIANFKQLLEEFTKEPASA